MLDRNSCRNVVYQIKHFKIGHMDGFSKFSYIVDSRNLCRD